jgi:hypothetical protein
MCALVGRSTKLHPAILVALGLYEFELGGGNEQNTSDDKKITVALALGNGWSCFTGRAFGKPRCSRDHLR